jgi:biopolymer transport protein ExbD
MASIEGGGGDDHHKKGPGVKKAKRLSTRVDMTPMVDLGFLLITFFIFTTTMSTPTTMNLNMPKESDKKDDETKIKMSGALTILLGKNEDNVYYYEGELDPVAYSNFKTATFKEIRDIIIKKKRDVIARYVPNAECEEQAKKDRKKDPKKECEDMDFFVVIKPDTEATYRRIVDILDEMTINVVGRYALIDITEDEDKLVKLTEKR